VLVLGQLALYVGTDTERRGIRAPALRKGPLQLLQLSKELVVLGVRECRIIENVVFVGRAIQYNA
jgi:hypothetical protein